MPPETKERHLQAAAHRFGLKIVLDRYSAAATGRKCYFLRPIWDARQAIRALPDGGYELVKILANGRRRSASLLLLHEVEQLLSRWVEPKSCAPARLPWQAGVVADAGQATSRSCWKGERPRRMGSTRASRGERQGRGACPHQASDHTNLPPYG